MTTKGADKTLQRYKVLEEIYKRKDEYQRGDTLVLKCLDRWSQKVVTLHCKGSLLHAHTAFNIQKCQGLMIADELQRLSNNFLKINDISYSSISYQEGSNFIINREYMDLTLDEALKTKSLSHDDKMRIFYKLCELASELEDAGVVHTNLNPHHVLLSDDLQQVKLCGFSHAVLVEELDASNQQRRKLWRETFSCIKHEDLLYRPIELLVYNMPNYQVPHVSSRQDVWSLGCIFATLFNDGMPIFGAISAGGQDYYNYAHNKVFTVLGYPTITEMDYGLKVTLHHQYGNGPSLEKLKKAISSTKATVEWIERILSRMLIYFPYERIGVKEIMGHYLFRKHWKKFGGSPRYEFPKRDTSIKMQFPEDLGQRTIPDIRGYFKSLFGVRRAMHEDRRKDLIVLALNLGDSTVVPAEIWLTIFVYADTKPIMFSK